MNRKHPRRSPRRGRRSPDSRRPPRRTCLRRIRAERLRDLPSVADLGYIGVEGINTVPHKRSPGIDLDPSQVEFNTALGRIRAAVEHAIAHLKTWRMLSEEGGRYRYPISKYASTVAAIVGLYFFAAYE
ncbi:transposase family protein [Pseudonocardia sp. ICBG601]|uniref:transposase family protein n=1 Tax=Pseudonocardia sp. ICBG601 TaxID=2846759 RepID=UPI001CF6CBB3|nr:transposase family protein [Pseudonocardia sp. ICBG601]